ncbi:MAG TPA: hypothetical protein VFA07_05205 [Chthonomonadaceae bacterium]|nr:hypothetical protein [Chthonomonadaceae bacterium]
MECPKCQSVDVRKDVPAIGKANTCQNCGWLEVTSVTVEPGMNTYERMKRAEIQKQAHTSSTDSTLHTCFMCGKSRIQIESAGLKLILGVYGGICLGCIRLCQEVMEKEGVKTP